MATSPDPGDPQTLNETLITRLKSQDHLHDPRVEAAFRAVPRHLFLPNLPLAEAYQDDAIPTKRLEDGQVVSSSSQPAIMAIMLEQLGLETGQHILEIGAGTGYNAALMAHIVGKTGRVTTLDIDEDIVEAARANLANAGYDRVKVVTSDGVFGFPVGAPYDRIVLTVGAWDIAPAWRDQLGVGGRLVLPVEIGGAQKSVAFKRRNDYLESLSVVPCGFMVLRGPFAKPACVVELQPGLHFAYSDQPVDAVVVRDLLHGPSHDHLVVGVQVTPHEIFDGLGQWLGLREPNLCGLQGNGESMNVTPYLFGVADKWRATSGLYEDSALCLLTRPADQTPPVDYQSDRREPFVLWVRSYGSSSNRSDTLAERLIANIRAWDEAGRPGAEGMHIRIYPADSDYQPVPGEIVVAKPRSKFVLKWRSDESH